MNTDDRGKWTSASNAAADALCPGRHLAQRDIPEPPPTPEALRGTRIHAWLAGQPIPDPSGHSVVVNTLDYAVMKDALYGANTGGLNPEELETAEAIRVQVDEILRDQFPGGCTMRFEKRLWMDIGKLRHSGKPDLLAFTDNRIVIADYKTGWGFVPDSDVNLQLRDLAVLAWETYHIAPIVVAKVQKGGKPVLCEYNSDDIGKAAGMLDKRVILSNIQGSPRIPGPVQCQYCRFRPQCPEAQATVTALQNVTDAAGALVDGATIARLLDAGKVAKQIIADNESRAKELLAQNPDAIPGWTLKKGACVREITDPETVASRFVKLGGEIPQFLKSVKVNISKLETLLREAKGYKGRDLDNAMKLLIVDCYQEKQNEPSLKRT